MKWKRIKRREGPTLLVRLEKIMQQQIAFHTVPMIFGYTSWGKYIMFLFLERESLKYNLIWKINKLRKRLLFIQGRYFRIKNISEGKLEVLLTAWDRLQYKLFQHATMKRDFKAKRMLLDILKIPHEIKCRVLKYYLYKCFQLF